MLSGRSSNYSIDMEYTTGRTSRELRAGPACCTRRGGRQQQIAGDQGGPDYGVWWCGIFCPGGLIQDPTQLQLMEQRQGERQQMVLDGCGGEGSGIKEAEEECCDEDSRNVRH